MMPDDLVQLEPTGQLELRDVDRREIFGRIIPYGETIMVRGRPESFAPGALADIDPTTIRLLAYHDPHRPIGKALAVEERADGAYALFRVSATKLGDEMLELVRDGVVDSMSPGFLPGVQTRDGTHRKIRALPEVSLVAFAAYGGAKVLATRKANMTDIIEPDPVVVETREVDLSPIETRLDDLTATLTRLESIVDAPRPGPVKGGPTPVDWFRAGLDALAGRFEKREALEAQFAEFQTRALADITGAFPENSPADDVSGLVVEEFIGSQLVNVLDTRRPLVARLGSFPMPRSGYAKIPVVTQHTEVDVRAGQKEIANSRKMIVTTAPFEAEWFDGAVDIALEVIRSAELSVIDMVWNDLLGQYAIATEAGVASAIEAGGLGFGYTGTALRTDTYEHFATDVATQAIEVFEDSGAPAEFLAVTKAQWIALVAMVDASDRRQFAPIGATNADATVALNAQSFTLPGGIEVFYGPGLTQAFISNTGALKFADGGPERVEALNVELMGRDLGILGRTMFVPRIPAGVRVFGLDPESA